MEDSQIYYLIEHLKRECKLKKKPSHEEMHSILSKPFNVEFKGMGLYVEKTVIDTSTLDCIKSTAKKNFGLKLESKEKGNGYVFFEPL